MKLLELVKSLGVETCTEGDHHCRPGWVQLKCPYCSDGRSGSWHLGFSLKDGRTNCYRCGGHNLVDALSKLSGRSFGAIKPLFSDLDSRPREEYRRPTGKLILPNGIDEFWTPHRSYLEGRRFDPDHIAEEWGVRGIAISSKLRWRLFIPIHYRREMVSWTTRAIGDVEHRYLAARPEQEAMNHRHLLYGEDKCGHSIIVHEGPIDVWRTGPGSVATFGTAFSKAQVRKIAKYRRRIICYDSGYQAQKKAEQLCDLLSMFPGETFRVELDAKDAGEASDREIKKLRKMLRG